MRLAPITRLLRAATLGVALAPAAAHAQDLGSRAPAARFADPQRAAKLASAYPAIDSMMRAFAEQRHVPGIAYGIVVDANNAKGPRGASGASARAWK